MMHASLLTILALVALSTATVSNIPSTPAIDTFDGDMQLQVGANKTISFQFGPNDGDKVDVKDAHEPTISALALGYSIGAQLDNLRCNDNLETKLQGDLQKVEDATKKRIDNVDLVTQRLDKLSDQNSKSIVAMKTQVDDAVQDLKDIIEEANNGGSGGSGGGEQPHVSAASWNPIGSTRVEDSRATTIFLTWPVTVPSSDPLIVHGEAELYTLVFTALDADGKPTSDTRTVGPVRAMTSRLLSVTLPAWFSNQKSLPKRSHFEASIEVFEQGRSMASPKDDVVKIYATAPKTDAPSDLAISGSKDTAKIYTLSLVLAYPYQNQWDDISVSVSVSNSRVRDPYAVTGDGQKREVKFTVTSGDDFNFDVRLTSSSAASGEKTVQTVAVKWTLVTLEKVDPILSPSQTAQILSRAGATDREWVQCFSARQSGGGTDPWNTGTMHTKCTAEGRKIIYLARRGDNMRVYGGYLYNGARRNGGYWQNGEMKNFMFRITSATADVEFAQNIGQHGRRGHYINDGYAYTTGGGHDMYCNSIFQGCYSNFDHGWWTQALGNHCYGQASTCQSWLTGGYGWNLNGVAKSVYTVLYSTN